AVRGCFEAASYVQLAPGGDVRFPRDVHVISASGEIRRVLRAFRHSYLGDLVAVQPMYLPTVRCTPDHRWFATTDPSRERVEEIPAKDLTPRHFLLLPKPAWPAARITLDVAELLTDVTVTFAIPRTLSPTEVIGIVAASDRGESSRSIGARLGKAAPYTTHVNSQLPLGR